MYLCESYWMIFLISLYIVSVIHFTLLAANGWYFSYWTGKVSLSTRYVIFSVVVFLFVIYFSIEFMVSNFWCPSPFNQSSSSLDFSECVIFNGSLKLFFNKRNTCFNLITNILSNPKIFSKDIQIFSYFLHMTDFGHVGEFLNKNRYGCYQMACSDINHKKCIFWAWHHLCLFVTHYNINPHLVNYRF